MRIAISTDGDLVSPHFGRCPSFTIVDIEGGAVARKEVISNPGHHPGYLPEFLHGKGVARIIAGGMGQRARALFDEKGIKTVMGVDGRIDEVIEKLTDGTLEGSENTCTPHTGKGYGLDKTACDHQSHEHE